MNHGIIVLDGPDGAGKTTLAKYLQGHYGAKYIDMTYRWKKNQFEYHTAAIHHAIQLSQKQLVVIDRWWMSENIYADVYRKDYTYAHIGIVLAIDKIGRAHV